MPEDQKKRVTVGETYVTSKASERIFLATLPLEWLASYQKPDFHIDFKVEMVEGGELTGTNFGVQLKGWTPKKNRKSTPRHSLASKQLRYFLDKCTIPIFLVLVDVTTKRCHWKFVQQYAKEHLTADKVRNQKSVTIRFSEGDLIVVDKLAAV